MSITTTELQQQYIAYFGRPGDPEGLDYWSSDATDISTAAEFADKIYAQSEYQTTTIASKTTAEQVNQLYLNLFGRAADADGLRYWTAEIKKETLSLSNLAYDLIVAAGNPISGNEGQAALDAATLNAKVAAAEAYTATVSGNAAALMAYQPGAAYESAVSFLSSVSFNSSVNQAVITTAAGLAPLNASSVTTFVGQMLQAQTAADAAEAAAAAAPDAEAAAAAQLQAAQLQAALAEAAAAQATLTNQQAIAAEKAEAAAAAEAAANAPQTLILKTTLDNLTGGSDDDIFNGAGGTIDSDILDGGDGNDTLKVTLNAGDDGSTFQSTNIENLKFRVTGGSDVNVDLGDAIGVTSITAERLSKDLILSDIQSIPTEINIDRNTSGNGEGALTVGIDGSLLTGTEDTVNVNISNSSDAGILTIGAAGAGIETINLVSTDDPAGALVYNVLQIDAAETSGTATLNISGAGDLQLIPTDAETINNSASAKVTINAPDQASVINHTGSGALILDDAAGLTRTVTASGTGALTVSADVAATDTLVGSSGNDRFDFQAALTVADTVTGGDGTDTLVILGDEFGAGGVSGYTKITGVETLEIDSDNSNGNDNIDFKVFTGTTFTTVNIDVIANSDHVILTDTEASTFGVTSGNTNALDHLDEVTVTLLDASGTTDEITINLNQKSSGAANATQNEFDIETFNVEGIETITINADSISNTLAADDIVIQALVDSTESLTTLNIAGDADFQIDSDVIASVTTVNASGATDAVTLVFADSASETSVVTYTGGSGVDTLSFGTSLTSADTVDGGGGTDVINATFGSGTVTPTNITAVETFNATFSGGALNASNLGDLSTLKIVNSTASTVVSGLQGTTSTITQLQNGTQNDAINLQYASGAASTVTLNNTGAAANITNASTTVNNVESLTVTANDSASSAADARTYDLGSLNGGAALKNLTVTSSTVDAQDTVDTGNVTAVNLETITITADTANAQIGNLINADDLTTVTLTNADVGSVGDILLGNIGTTTAADDLTSFTVITSGDSVDAAATDVTVGILDAGTSTTKSVIETYTVNLAGDYDVSEFDHVEARTINGIDITAGVHGDSLEHFGFDLSGSLAGDLNITIGGEDLLAGGANPTAGAFFSGETTEIGTAGGANAWLTTGATGTVGNVNLTLTAEGGMYIAQHHADDIFIDAAITVGDLNFNTGTSTAGTNDISVGEIQNATTIGNINVSGSGSTTLDGAEAATSVGNITVDVEAGETVTLGLISGGVNLDHGFIGTTNGVVGNITGTGAGTVNVAIGPVTTIGNIDLSAMTASTSSSTIGLHNDTGVGVVYSGSAGADNILSTGGADVINPGLGQDYVQGNAGADLITLTETVNSTDTVALAKAGAATVDTITGFVPGAGGDVIGIDLTNYTTIANNAITLGFVTLEGANNEAVDSVLIANIGAEAATNFVTVAAGETKAQANDPGNFLFVSDTDINAVGEFIGGQGNQGAVTLTTAHNTADGDLFPGVWYDADGKFAEVGIEMNAADASIVLGTEWTPLARISMSATEYAALTVDNFMFLPNM